MIINLHIYWIHLLSPYKTVVSHLKKKKTFRVFALQQSVCVWLVLSEFRIFPSAGSVAMSCHERTKMTSDTGKHNFRPILLHPVLPNANRINEMKVLVFHRYVLWYHSLHYKRVIVYSFFKKEYTITWTTSDASFGKWEVLVSRTSRLPPCSNIICWLRHSFGFTSLVTP